MKKILSLLFTSLLIVSCGTSQNNSATKLADPTTYANTITLDELKKDLYTYSSEVNQAKKRL